MFYALHLFQFRREVAEEWRFVAQLQAADVVAVFQTSVMTSMT